MLTHPTVNKLRELRLTGMAEALEEQLNIPDVQDLGFEERLGLLVDREASVRHNRLPGRTSSSTTPAACTSH